MTEMSFEIKYKAENYCWSSAKAHLTGSIDSLLHGSCWQKTQQRKNYCEFIRHNNDDAKKAIRKATRSGRHFGSEEIIDSVGLLKADPAAAQTGKVYKKTSLK